MNARLIIVLCGTALLLTLLPLRESRAESPAPRGHAVSGGCATAGSVRFGTIDAAIAAARRLLIVGRTVHVQGRKHRLTPANQPILAAIELASDIVVSGTSSTRLRRIAAQRCGREVAAKTWALVIGNPFTLVASNSIRIAFVVKTASGWRTY